MKIAKKVLSILGIVAGLVSLILGFSVRDLYTGSWMDSTISFGADFYTYSYQATAKAVNNVENVADVLAKGIGNLLIVAGLITMVAFALKTIELFAKNGAKAPAAPQYAAPQYDPQAYVAPQYDAYAAPQYDAQYAQQPYAVPQQEAPAYYDPQAYAVPQQDVTQYPPQQ